MFTEIGENPSRKKISIEYHVNHQVTYLLSIFLSKSEGRARKHTFFTNVLNWSTHFGENQYFSKKNDGISKLLGERTLICDLFESKQITFILSFKILV